MRRTAAILLSAALCLPAQQEVPTFKASANLVIVTVFVRDRQGKSIEGLKKSDFEVLENNLPQNVAVFEYQKVENEVLPKYTATVTAEAAPESRPIERPSFGAERAKYRDRRLLVLYFDWSSMQPDEQIRAREGAEKFLRQDMTASDLVSIMSYTSRLRVDSEFTNDRAALLAVLKKYEDASFTDAETENLNTDDNAEETGFAADDSEFNLFNTDKKLNALEKAVQVLGAIPEKKAVIYYSSGVGQTGVDNQSQLRATTNAAIRANVSFYPVDARGLKALPPGGDAGAASPRGQGVYSGGMQRQQRDNFRGQQDTLFALASDTGGKASLDDNDLSMGAITAQKDVQAYYLLGYYSSDERRDGKYRRVEVKLAKGVDARIDFRRGYFAEKEFRNFTSSDKERQLQDALQSGDPITDLPLALEVDYFQASAGSYFVPVVVKIPGSQIPLAKKGAIETTEFDFVGEIRTANNTQAAVLRDTIKLKLPESRLQSRSLVYDAGFSLGPGEFRIKILARENITGKVGTFETKFTLPDWSRASQDMLKVSSLVLASARQPVKEAAGSAAKGKTEKKQQNHPLIKNGMKLVPSVTRVFQTEQPIRAFAEVYDAKVQASLAIYDGTKKVYESRGTVSVDKAVEVAVPPRTLAPGRYVAQLNMIDTEKGRFEFLRAPLIVDKPAAPPATAK